MDCAAVSFINIISPQNEFSVYYPLQFHTNNNRLQFSLLSIDTICTVCYTCYQAKIYNHIVPGGNES